MSDSTPTPADDELDRRAEDELAPEEELLRDWLPDAEPTDGPAPAP